MDDQATSPTPGKSTVDVKESLTFYDALKKIVEGEKVTKLEWHDNNVYGFLKGENLTIHLDTGDKDWIVRDADMAGEDWVVL